MYDILKKIVDNKLNEVALLKKNFPNLINEVSPRAFNKGKSLHNALKNNDLSIIAEIKRRSPSAGDLATINDPLAMALSYIKGGANAISILTDKVFFNGSNSDLESVSNAIKEFDTPILRKEFIVDPFQIYESVKIGADAILLIVNVLMEKTKDFISIANDLNIETLVEIHTMEELAIAIDSGAKIIGVNNRDLNTFTVDIKNSLELFSAIPKEIIKVSESGINSVEKAKEIRKKGYDAVLVGEFLVSSKDSSKLITQMRETR